MLKFIYGVMGSSKTAQALITEYNYKKIGYNVIMLKPSTDTRSLYVESRIGLKSACIVFDKNTSIFSIVNLEFVKQNKVVIIVDECQFCTSAQIEELRLIANYVDVTCYGLKTNFKTVLFEGSKRLLEIADNIEEISHVCECGNKALFNALFENNILVNTGDEIHIGDTEYKPLCYNCYHKYLKIAKEI